MDLNLKRSASPAREVAAAPAKTCADCLTTRTPLWRGGPAGPRSLCNACGIRNRKRRRALLGLGKSEKKVKNDPSKSSSEMGVSVNLELVELGREMELQRSWGSKKEMKKKKKKPREEEVAAMLLMALSCGSVFA